MDYEQLIKLIETVSASSLTGFQYDDGSLRLKLKKETTPPASQIPANAQTPVNMQAPVNAQIPVNAQMTLTAAGMQDGERFYTQSAGVGDDTGVKAPVAGDAPEEKPGNLIKSPLVGTFYEAPSEDADPFVSVGDTVKKGQVLAIVEAMKLMNDIESDFSGVVAEVLVSNGETVEYGQPLFRIV